MSAERFIGRRVGNYIVESTLGEGGMGWVFTARHPGIGQRAALKVLRAELVGSAEIVARFEAEARAASSIRHPNIVRTLDAGTLDSGEPYILLEHLEGQPLDKTPLPLLLDTALVILVQVCSALDAAHAAGIIHRDLKPANLFVAPQPTNPLHTVVLDFGIAKLAGDTAVGGVHTRTHGAVMGTPAYMAPEVARGGAARVGVTADVYALGVIAYELVTAKRPYQARSIGEIVFEQVESPLPDPGALRPDLPGGWRDVIRACLALDPRMRPQSAGAVAELLARATPRGDELARSVGFMPTGTARLPAPADTAALDSAAEPTATPTTMGASAGESRGPTGQSAGPRRPWAIGGGLVATLGLAGAAVALLTASSGGAGAPSAEPETPTVAASPSPRDAAEATAAPDARDSVSLRILAEPAGATIYVDGEPAGTAPVSIERAPGTHIVVRAEAAGHEPLASGVTIPRGDPEPLRLALTPVKSAEDPVPSGRTRKRPPEGATPGRSGRKQPSQPTKAPLP